MNKYSLLTKIAGFLGILVLFLLFRISNIDFHCDPQATGLSYCRLQDQSPRFLEGVAALVPESLQAQAGERVSGLIPDIMTTAESNQAVQLTSSIYGQMQTDPTWAFANSSLGFTYESLLRIPSAPDQYYVYVPPHDPEAKLPVLLYLHGFGGNFTSSLYELSKAADWAQFAIVAPTYGQGNWDPQSLQFVQSVLTDAGIKFPIDVNRITLMGFSDGGLIVSNFIPAFKHNLRNVVLLSTYTELGQYTQPEVLAVLQKVVTLEIIYGDKDTHIDASNIPVKAQKLSQDGVNVQVDKVTGENHLLFWSQPQVVIDDLKTLQY